MHNCKLENLTVKTRVFVDRIIMANNNKSNAENREYRAVGVEAHDDVNGEPMVIKARKEIILSAG